VVEFFCTSVFSTFGGMSGCTHVVYKRVAYLLSLKRGVPYCSVMAWLRRCINFSLFRQASFDLQLINCLREARSHSGCPITHIGVLILPLRKVKCLSLNYFVFFSRARWTALPPPALAVKCWTAG